VWRWLPWLGGSYLCCCYGSPETISIDNTITIYSFKFLCQKRHISSMIPWHPWRTVTLLWKIKNMLSCMMLTFVMFALPLVNKYEYCRVVCWVLFI
jgi:hypothetical protein